MPLRISALIARKAFFLGSFYTAPVIMFALSTYLLSEDNFTQFNFIFLTAGLISFLVDFGDEIYVPKKEMEESLSPLALRRILLRRMKRALVFSVIFLGLALKFGSPIDMIWAIYPLGGALTLAFWYKAKGNMTRLIEASIPVRMACVLLVPIYAHSTIGIHVASLVFYFTPSLFLLLYDKPTRVNDKRAAGKAPMPRIDTREGIAGFVLLACNLLSGWLPFFLSDQGLLNMTNLGLIFVRSTGFISQFMGILTALMHRRIWAHSVALDDARRRLIAIVTIGIAFVVLLVSLQTVVPTGDQTGDLVTYIVARLFFFYLIFIVLIHITETFWLSLASILPVLGWLLAVLMGELTSPFTLVNASYAISLTFLAYRVGVRVR